MVRASRPCTAAWPGWRRPPPAPPPRSTPPGDGRTGAPARQRRGSPCAAAYPGPPPGAACSWAGPCATCRRPSRHGCPGIFGEAHVAALARARTPATEVAMARDEAMLVTKGVTLRHASFLRVMAYWSHHADADGTEDEAQRLRDDRRFHLRRASPGSGWAIWCSIPSAAPSCRPAAPHRRRPVRGRLLRGQGPSGRRCRCERPGPHPGPAPGRRPGGDGQAGRHGARRRSPSRALVHGVGGLRDLCRADVRAGQLRGRHRGIARQVVGRGLDRAGGVRRAVPGRRRRPAARRLFPEATRRAVEVRDQQCFHQMCDVPAEQCRSTMSSPGPPAGPPSPATGGRPAPTTTANAIDDRRQRLPPEAVE